VKHYGWLSLLLLSPLALGQAAPATARPGARLAAAAQRQQEEDEVAAPKVPLSQVPATTPVITVQGLCTAPPPGAHKGVVPGKSSAESTPKADCKTVITRAQFERLADALNPDMPRPTKVQLAEAYPRLLMFAQKARQMGLDKEARFQEMLKFATLQLLAQNLTRDLQKKAGEIPDSEVEKYYKDNPTKFQQLELLRIFVPKSKQHVPVAGSTQPSKVDTAADEAAMKAEAEKVHTAAASGGDFQNLQKEAFETAGIKSQSPSVNLGKVTREGLPTNHQKVFELQAGQVSELLDDPGGYYIYKVTSKEMVPLEKAKSEIHNFLQQQEFQKEMQGMIGSVKPELNQAYFGGGTGRPGAPNNPAQPKPPTGKPSTPPSPK
jgi:hypothetical protein